MKGDLIDRQAKIDAIDVLKRNYPSSCFEELCKAVDIAIKALSTQPDVPDTNVGDMISRQAAIEALMNNEPSAWNNDDYERGEIARFHEDVTTIKNVPSIRRKRKPSAQPDLDEWCTDCKEYDQERHCCPRWNRVIRNALKDAEPERKSGTWIYDGEKRICPFCKDFIVTGRSIVKYCWNCGARLNERSKE